MSFGGHVAALRGGAYVHVVNYHWTPASGAARLVTLGEGTAEVAHEVLIREWPTLRGWLEEDRAGIRLHRELGDAARRWDTGGREAGTAAGVPPGPLTSSSASTIGIPSACSSRAAVTRSTATGSGTGSSGSPADGGITGGPPAGRA